MNTFFEKRIELKEETAQGMAESYQLHQMLEHALHTVSELQQEPKGAKAKKFLDKYRKDSEENKGMLCYIASQIAMALTGETVFFESDLQEENDEEENNK